MPVIDADTHVIESEAIWEFFDEDMASRKPVLVPYRDPTGGNLRNFWVLDGKVVPKPQGKGGQALATPPIDPDKRTSLDWRTRDLSDVGARLAAADKMGVETQVIYPTLFIAYLTDDVALEVALCRAYNRFQADVWSRGGGRLRWVVVPPLQNVDKSIEELHFGKEHGAVGVMFRGIEKDRSLADPYFFPVYREAGQLGLSVCIHTGPGCPTLTEMTDSRLSFVFQHVRMLPVMAFHDLIVNRVPEKFPDLRIGFIETNSSWVPFLAHYLKRRLKTNRDGVVFSRSLFQDYRLYVACEADEDLPYLLNYVGEDNMVTGSDYGHQDQSAEPQLIELLRERNDVDPATMDKILVENPARFYGI